MMSTDLAISPAEGAFALKQRQAKAWSSSELVPDTYRNNIPNTMIAMNVAERLGIDVLTVMQELYVVHGKPAWSSKFLIGSFNSCGRFGAIHYRLSGTGDDYGCEAVTSERETGREIVGPKVTWKMVKAEKWSEKNGSKWKTMPELMFRYRAAAFLIRTTAPEIGLGLLTRDEAEDAYASRTIEAQVVTPATIAARLTAKPAEAVEAEPVANESMTTPGEAKTIRPRTEWEAEILACKTPAELEPTIKRITAECTCDDDEAYLSSLADFQREAVKGKK